MPTESTKAAACYAAYAEMGPERSLAKLYELGRTRGDIRASKVSLEKWSSACHWQARVAQFDSDQRERQRKLTEDAEAAALKRKAARDAKREADRERMDDERVEIMRATWQKTLGKIDTKLGKKDEAPDTRGIIGLVSLLKHAMDEERLALGGATAKQAVDVTSNGQTLKPQVVIYMPHEDPDPIDQALLYDATPDDPRDD